MRMGEGDEDEEEREKEERRGGEEETCSLVPTIAIVDYSEADIDSHSIHGVPDPEIVSMRKRMMRR